MAVRKELSPDAVNRRFGELSRFLADVPSAKSLLEYLVIEEWGRWQARAALLLVPEESGYFRLDAAFGAIDASAFESNPPSIWGEHPLALALMNGGGSTSSLQTELILRPCISSEDADCLAVQHIRANHHERFVLAVACADGQANAEGCLSDLVDTTPLISLYLSFLQTKRAMVAEGNWGREDSDASQALTPRQLTILRLMSDGMKNREIAFAIGFSDSTVRLETIEIYKKLGVHGRHEAIRVAVRLGLLEDPPPRDVAGLIRAGRR